MESAEIARRFLDYFKQQGHAIVPSARLVADDPTVLFVIAGMQPFREPAGPADAAVAAGGGYGDDPLVEGHRLGRGRGEHKAAEHRTVADDLKSTSLPGKPIE